MAYVERLLKCGQKRLWKEMSLDTGKWTPSKAGTTIEVVRALNRIEKHYGSQFFSIFKSITVDNGVEFSDFDKIVNKSDVKAAEKWMNEIPRTVFGGRSAEDIFREHTTGKCPGG